MEHGVYVLQNRGMPGLVKIGMTTRSVYARIGELNSTGVPYPFKLAEFFPCDFPKEIEGKLHAHFAHKRVNNGREFFRVSPETVASLVRTYGNINMGQDKALALREAERKASIRKTIATLETKLAQLNRKIAEYKRKYPHVTQEEPDRTKAQERTGMAVGVGILAGCVGAVAAGPVGWAALGVVALGSHLVSESMATDYKPQEKREYRGLLSERGELEKRIASNKRLL